MRVFDKRKPNVKSLAKAGDVEGLIDATRHQELVPGRDGTTVDVGAPVREEAVFALRDVAPDRAGDAFVRALSDPVDGVRCAAAVALYERGDAEALADAVAVLPAEAGKARDVALRALFELRKPQTSRRLAHALVYRRDERPLKDADASLVPSLLRAEGRPEAPGEVVELLVVALGDERDAVADRAEDMLVRLAPASTEALIRELASGAAPRRAAAALGTIKDARALESLVAALSHPDSRVRGECCVALGELRDPAAVEHLLAATRDPEHGVRLRAGAALDSMGTAAVAVSVATLLRPLLSEALGAEKVLGQLSSGEMPSDDGAELPPAAPPETPGAVPEGPTMLRRLARFIDRVEDARSRETSDAA
jgi:HEAT repeat protein